MFSPCQLCFIYFNKEYSKDCDDKCEFAKAILENKKLESNSRKTMLEDFAEKFPKYKRNKDGTPIGCPDDYGYENKSICQSWENIVGVDCFKCWSRLKEN